MPNVFLIFMVKSAFDRARLLSAEPVGAEPILRRVLKKSYLKRRHFLANGRWFLGVADTNDVIQKIEKTLNNTHTTTQKLTNNSFRNTKKHPNGQTLA